MNIQSAPLSYRGGLWGAFAPLLVFLFGVTWLGLSGYPSERGMWPILMIALGVGVLVCRTRTDYAEAVIKGMSEPILAVMILAWMLAGMLARLLEAGGLISILEWASQTTGVTGAGYCVAAFLVSSLVSTSTGTSLGTLALCGPSLFLAGIPAGADPAILIGAILGGATFGDNISPVSDTTIASTVTQGARMGAVVRSRLRYAVPAALIAIVATFVFHGPPVEPTLLETNLSAAAPVSEAGASTTDSEGAGPKGWPILAAPVLVVILLFRQVHLLAALLGGIAAAAVIGVGAGLFQLGDLIAVDKGANPYEAGGLLLDGMNRGVGISVFTLLLMGLVSGFEASGLIQKTLKSAEKRIRSPRGAEWWSFGAVSITTMLTTHSVVALLAVGPFVRKTGSRHGLSPERRANLLDITVCTYPFLLPYCIPTVFAATQTLHDSHGGYAVASQTAVTAGLFNFHSWALLLVVILSIITGWGRGTTEPQTRRSSKPGSSRSGSSKSGSSKSGSRSSSSKSSSSRSRSETSRTSAQKTSGSKASNGHTTDSKTADSKASSSWAVEFFNETPSQQDSGSATEQPKSRKKTSDDTEELDPEELSREQEALLKESTAALKRESSQH